VFDRECVAVLSEKRLHVGSFERTQHQCTRSSHRCVLRFQVRLFLSAFCCRQLVEIRPGKRLIGDISYSSYTNVTQKLNLIIQLYLFACEIVEIGKNHLAAAGAPPRTPLGSLHSSPDTLAGAWGGTSCPLPKNPTPLSALRAL